MLFYDCEGFLCAYIRNRGFVYVDEASPQLDELVPAYEPLSPCDEAAPYTNPYGDVLLVHSHLPADMCYNTVLQDLVREDWHNMFTVEDGERNPYTDILHGEVNADLRQPVPDGPFEGRATLYSDVWLSYEPGSKKIHVHKKNDSDVATCLFDMKKDEFIDTFDVRCIGW